MQFCVQSAKKLGVLIITKRRCSRHIFLCDFVHSLQSYMNLDIDVCACVTLGLFTFVLKSALDLIHSYVVNDNYIH